ncbi:MAG TPA: serine/threonine-protein kinase [Polyangiaceae bacterium]|jgi:serine/threonine-protein kinase|nr:serine/threonine-protein kinase [Polyangiaceae bacterium]
MLSDWEGDYLQPGTLIEDKFEVRRLLGKGAMGAVVEATHLLRRAPVALKFMGPHMLELPGVVERFLNEGVAASRINSEHVVKVLDVSKLPTGVPYLVMEYLEGEDLSQLLEREGKRGLPDVARAVHFILQVLRGLQVAHQAGIVHRDLKPANCFVVNRDGEPDFIKIVDFGISKVQQAEGELILTQEGSTMGTPLYVSLEQARDAANVDARSDLYSVAVILYELLAGHTPFMPKTMPELFIQLATVTPKSLDQIRDLPPGLADLVQKGLEKQREDRFQSTSEMAAALAPYADQRSELVLRQLLQRGSARVTRPPSGPPSSVEVPALGAPNLGTPVTPNEGSGTLQSVSRTPAVAGRSVALAGVSEPSHEPRARAKWALPAIAVALVAAAVGGLFAMRARSSANASAEPATEAAAHAAAAERVTPPTPTATPPETPKPLASEMSAPSASASAPAAAAASAAVTAPSGKRANSTATHAPATLSSALPPEQKQAQPQTSEKPQLKKIGIQD